MKKELEGLVKRTKDLYKQATTEKTHYYTASILKEWLLFAESLGAGFIRKQDIEFDEETLKGYEESYPNFFETFKIKKNKK